MAGGPEIVGFGGAFLFWSTALYLSLFATGSYQYIGFALSAFSVYTEVAMHRNQARWNKEIIAQWQSKRATSGSGECHVDKSEVSNLENHSNTFAFQEVLKYCQSASAETISQTLAPLMHFKPVSQLTDEELTALFLRVITLNDDGDNQSGIAPEKIIDTYIQELVSTIRAKCPYDGSSTSSSSSAPKPGPGFDFWFKTPVRWSFPSMTLKAMDLHQNIVYLIEQWKRGWTLEKANTNYPIMSTATRGLKSDDVPLLFFHGATCKYLAILGNVNRLPSHVDGKPLIVLAPLLTVLWFYGAYSPTSHLVTTEKYYAELHEYLQKNKIKKIRIGAWSLGCLLSNGFLTKYGKHYTVEEQIYMEPLGSLASCCLTYACVCEPMSTVTKTFMQRGGGDFAAKTWGFAIFMKNDALSRCYYTLLPFRNVNWGSSNGDFKLMDSKKTLVLLSSGDPITYLDYVNGMYTDTYFPNSQVVARPGFHGTWPREPLVTELVTEWFNSHSLPKGVKAVE
eukprot:m.227495 g.227495  ORF g.227495 m.227495 type:complete len:508 (-) comp33523_c0_seq3:1696-3219(-)